jgi:hypothetical protein
VLVTTLLVKSGRGARQDGKEAAIGRYIGGDVDSPPTSVSTIFPQ